MDKKKVVKWVLGILANLVALVTIYLTANPQLLPKNLSKSDSLRKAKSDSLDRVAATRFVPSYSKSANPGLLSRVANQVNKQLAADQRLREERPHPMSRQDTIANCKKTPVYSLQQQFFEDSLSKWKKEIAKKKDPKTITRTDTLTEPYNETDWDNFNNIKTTAKLGEDTFQLKPYVQVFGWHPYWMGSAYKSYNFSLLSTIAYYGAEFDPKSGDILNTHGWESSGIFYLASFSNCRVELTFSNTGSNNNYDFLNDSASQDTLVHNIIGLLRNHGDGVCLNFEDVPTQMRNNLTSFVTMLHDSLQIAAKNLKEITDPELRYINGFSITMVLPCFDWTGAFDVKKIAPVVDRFVVTGYDYYGLLSDSTGPVAPLNSGLTWHFPNIERSVDTYLKKGIPPAKLLLGLPYYGTSWQTVNSDKSSASVRFLDFTPYREMRHEVALHKIEINYDTSSVSAFYVSRGIPVEQHWFDNQVTLSEKYRWVMRKRLGGVGIWALGYDNGYSDLWQALRDNFGRYRLSEDTTYKSMFVATVHDTLPLPQDKEWGIVAANGHYLIFDNPYVLLYGTLAVFAIILLLQVILDEQPFNELFSKRLLLFILSSLAGTVAIIFLGLALWSKVPHREIYLLLAGIIGGYLLFRLTQRIVGKKERLP